jgi:hypothetical protein
VILEMNDILWRNTSGVYPQKGWIVVLADIPCMAWFLETKPFLHIGDIPDAGLQSFGRLIR